MGYLKKYLGLKAKPMKKIRKEVPFRVKRELAYEKIIKRWKELMKIT